MSKISGNHGYIANRNGPYVYKRKTGQISPDFGPKFKAVPVDVSTKIDFDVNQNVESTNIKLEWLKDCIDSTLKGKIFLKCTEFVTIVTVFH